MVVAKSAGMVVVGSDDAVGVGGEPSAFSVQVNLGEISEPELPLKEVRMLVEVLIDSRRGPAAGHVGGSFQESAPNDVNVLVL